jgi:type I restriction enzyme S subunit
VGERPIVFGGFVFRGCHRTADLDYGYAKFALRGPHVREQIISRGQGGVRANLGQRDLKLVSVMLPPVKEQRVIAEAVDDAADQISILERLIAKKRAIKQGMMQQLLSGRMRLAEFSEPWQEKRVADVGEVLAGKALNIGGAGKRRPYLRTKNVLDGRIDLSDVLHMPMTDSEFERFRLEPGDVLLNEGQSLELVGRCSIYSGEFAAPVAMQNQLLRFRAFSETSPEFAAHLFRNCQKAGVFAGISTKTTSIAHLGCSRLSDLRLTWPSEPHEQQAIASVLTDADTELATLTARLAKARAVKQGMLQQLLTGKIRLPVPDSALEDPTP